MARDNPGSVTSQSGKLVFASSPQATVVLPAVAANVSLPTVTIPAADLPGDLTITHVRAAISWRKQVDSSGSANAIVNAQQVQVRADTPGTFIDGITIPDNALSTGANATEGGVMLYGDSDVSSEVDGADSYEFQWTAAAVDGASLTLHDVQTYLIIEHT